ncbi:MAG: hypothetical protein QOJ00_2903 [Actinomycetota bacterium]|jgi:DNA-binding MarR family transcriptional regulator
MNLSNEDFVRLLTFRDGLRRFLSWSETEARAAGVTPAQHQLLLAIRGHGSSPKVGDLGEHLMLRHHSVVELIDRAEAAGLVRRVADVADHRMVRVELRPKGLRVLEKLSAAHLEELSRLVPSLAELWSGLPSG